MFLFITAHQRSGTYIYTKKLTSHFPRDSYSIIHSSSHIMDVLGIPFDIVMIARKRGHKFVIVEYEYSMFGPPLFTHIVLILTLILARISLLKPVVVLHGVLHPNHLCKGIASFFVKVFLTIFYRFIEIASMNLYVLNSIQYRLLKDCYRINKLKMVPHGADQCISSGDEIKSNSDEIRIFFHGFLRPSKGLDELIEAVEILSKAGYNVQLEIWGSIPHQMLRVESEREWLKKFLEKVKMLMKQKMVKIHIGFASEEELKKAVMSCDIIVLPYKDHYFESSGVLHLFMDCGKPFILSRIPRFYADVDPSEAVFVNVNGPELAKAVVIALNKGKILAHRLKIKANERSWKKTSLTFITSLTRE
ncbi:MAG: glycosyltransferase [Candidatus Korarchaeota archaeon]|nr:glycosyltransferase [Thermoproteota archaeon]